MDWRGVGIGNRTDNKRHVRKFRDMRTSGNRGGIVSSLGLKTLFAKVKRDTSFHYSSHGTGRMQQGKLLLRDFWNTDCDFFQIRSGKQFQ